MSSALPRFVVLKPSADAKTYIHRRDDNKIAFVEKSVFSPTVKVEVERAKINSNYVHLRFDYSNKYWQRIPDDTPLAEEPEDGRHLVAISTTPEEDLSKAGCTLFQATVSGSAVSFVHLATGLRVVLGATSLFLDPARDAQAFSFMDWSPLVKLPKHVAFRAKTGNYLKAYMMDGGWRHLRFNSTDPNDEWSGFEVDLMDDGHVRIKSTFWGKYWTIDFTNAIFATVAPGGNIWDRKTLFWPVYVDENTVCLRSAHNNMFLKYKTWDDKVHTLIADVPGMTEQTKFTVKELVASRKIYNVRYRMEDARIYNEAPFVAGTTYVDNRTSETEGAIAVALTFTDESSYSFNTSMSVTAGVTVTFEGGVPNIAKSSIEVNFSTTMGMEWGKETRTSTSVTATGSVPVPPMSRATVSYVGTRATCDVPFSYTYQDRSSVDGRIIENDSVDGYFTGVNSYNFTFIIQKIIPL